MVPEINKYNMTDMGPPWAYLQAQGSTKQRGVHRRPVPILSKFLTDIELNVFLEFLGVEDEEAYYDLKAYINLLDMADSRINLSLKKSAQGANLLNVYYESGDLYIDTDFLDIGKVLLKDVGNILSGVTPAEEYEQEFLNEETVSPAKTFLDLIFFEGGLGFAITKEVLISVLMLLGLDLEGYFDEFDFEFGAVFTINPLHGDIYAEFNTARFGLILDSIDIQWQYEGRASRGRGRL